MEVHSVLKTKEQIAEQQREKLTFQVEAVQKDIKGLSEDVTDIFVHKKQIKDVTPEVFNILMGIQRDLRFGRDRLKRID